MVTNNCIIFYYTVMMNYYDFNPFTGRVTSIDTIPLRYCFTPGCEAIDEVFVVDLAAFTEGCGGSDTTESSLTVVIEFTPPVFTLDIPTDLKVTYGESICFEFGWWRLWQIFGLISSTIVTIAIKLYKHLI